ncbi:hypothetical protein TrVE_jg11997 [Triparma verrucosa]|uniref:Uncharacterized protein n=2 Tax=Triparma TaxID=722752 RepID=A0A9W7DSC2_9STRA|nr:hypothetical protein TrST_g2218 [Triparma strigata]GMI15542.1 hypothetical protein TrVE_jg11997 [Triparma verrucosa]
MSSFIDSPHDGIELSSYSPPTGPSIKLQLLPLLSACGNKDATGASKNTGLSIWFGAKNLINVLPELLLDYNSDYNKEVGGPGDNRTNRILELGAGTGLTGIWLLHHLSLSSSPFHLTLTDGVDEVLPLLSSNLLLNSPPPSSYSVSNLLWGATLPQTYDFIYGADLIYERVDTTKVRQLASTVRSGLTVEIWESPPSPLNIVDSSTLLDGEEGCLPPCLLEPFKVGRLPFFILAFTRRSFPFPSLIRIFAEEGLKCKGLVEDGTYDIFENETDGLTDMWRDCVVGFEPIMSVPERL